MPAAAPPAMPMAVAQTAMISRTQPPLSTRDSTSRPRKSPPSGNCPEGLPKAKVIRASGEFGATNGPMIATSTTNEASPRPIMPRGVLTADQSTDPH